MKKDKCLKYKENKNKSRKANKPKMFPAEDVVRGAQFLAKSMIECEGLELVHIEFINESIGWVLRCYIDRSGGVTIDDCADVSRMLGDILDVTLENWLEKQQSNSDDANKPIDMYLPSYTLEVSSPGERRPLSRHEDFIRFKGHHVMIKVKSAINAQKRFKGQLIDANDSQVTIETSTTTADIAYENIRMARLES